MPHGLRRWLLRRAVPLSRNFSAWLGAIFAGPERRLSALLAGFVMAFGGSLALSYNTSFGAFLLSVAASVIAAALIEMHFRHGSSIEHIRETGIRFIGDRKLFDAVRMRGNRLGWDAWINETPVGGHLLVVGRQNGHWIDSAGSLKSLLDKEGTIEFVFMGSKQNIKNWIAEFQKKWTDKFGESPPADRFRFLTYIAEDPETVPESGYYWNGRELLVKVYVPGQPKPDCPIIAFDARGAGGDFNVEDFHPDQVPYRQAQALIQAANGLNRLICKARNEATSPPSNE